MDAEVRWSLVFRFRGKQKLCARDASSTTSARQSFAAKNSKSCLFSLILTHADSCRLMLDMHQQDGSHLRMLDKHTSYP